MKQRHFVTLHTRAKLLVQHVYIISLTFSFTRSCY